MSKILDEKLIRAAIEGDTEGIEILKDRIKAIALSEFEKSGIQRSDENVEMLTSQIKEQVLNALHQFRFRVSFETWVYRITVNMILKYQRRVISH